MMRNSYFPSTITAWNNLDPDVRQSQTLSNFKYAIKSRNGIYRVPKHFLIGDRKTNILLTRLRNGCKMGKMGKFILRLLNRVKYVSLPVLRHAINLGS